MSWRMIRRVFLIVLSIQVALLERHSGGGAAPMAVLLIEGFDNFGQTADLALKGWSSAASLAIQSGRFGGNSIQGQATTATNYIKSLPSSGSTMIMGCAVQLSSPSGPTDLLAFRAAGTNVARLGIDANNHLIVRNSGGTTIATGTTVLLANAWNYVELKVFINGASGTCEVHLNGVSEIASTTGNFGSTNIDSFVFITGGASSNNRNIFDDIYVLDTTGSSPRNTFLGDVRVATIFPTGAGNYTQWTPDSGSNYARVNESSGTYPDGDTSYVSDATPGHRDSYAFGDIDGGATVYGVQVNVYARKDDASTRQIAPFIRQSGTDYDGTTVTMTSSYAFYTQLYNQDPASADWTPTTVNGDEYGIKEIA